MHDQDVDNKGICARLAQLIELFPTRKAASLTSKKSVDMLASYSSGKRDAPLRVVIDLASAQNVSLDWIASGKGEMFISGKTSDPRLQNDDVVALATLMTLTHLRKIGHARPSAALISAIFLENLSNANKTAVKADLGEMMQRLSDPVSE